MAYIPPPTETIGKPTQYDEELSSLREDLSNLNDKIHIYLEKTSVLRTVSPPTPSNLVKGEPESTCALIAYFKSTRNKVKEMNGMLQEAIDTVIT